MTTAPKYDFYYWLEELVACGRTIEPEKYSAAYIEHMKREWRQVSMTRLHLAVLKRRKEVGIGVNNE